MALTERLALIVDAKTGGAVREFDKVSREVDKLGKETTKTGGLIGRLSANTGVSASALKAGLATAAVTAGAALVKFGADGVQAASSLEQSVGAVESVFGSSSKAIFEFGETAANSAGLSKREVNEMAAVVGAQLQGMGFSAAASADEVLKLERRAADMAATFGGSTKNALDAISATLRGERDPIEKYGVSLKAVDVNARVAALGLDTGTVAAKKQAEATAALSLVMEQTAKTEGQFAREGDTLAGAQARLQANTENLQAAIGEGLTPALADLASAANLVIGPLTKLINTGNKFGKVSDLLSFVNPITSAGKAIDAFNQFKGTLDGTADAADDVEESAGGMVPEVEDAAAAADEADKNFKKLQGALIDAARADRSYQKAQQDVKVAQLGVVAAQRDLNDLLKRGAVDAKAVAAAQRDVTDAARSLGDAEQRVLDIKTRIAELEAGPSATDAEQSAIDLARARDGVADAEARLAKLRAGQPQDALDVARAENQLQAAELRLSEVRADGEATALDVSDAELDVLAARRNLDNATRPHIATEEELADAELDLRQAKLDLIRTEQEQTGTTKDLDAARDDLADAERGVADAQARAKDAGDRLREAQAGDPEFTRKVTEKKWELADAQQRVSDAQFNAGIQAIALKDAMNAQRDAVIADADAVKRLRDEFYLLGLQHPVLLGILGALGQSAATVQRPGTPTTANVQRFHQGGVVPGPRGMEVPIIAQAGETILPIGASGGGNTTIVKIDATGMTADQVVALVKEYERRNGAGWRN